MKNMLTMIATLEEVEEDSIVDELMDRIFCDTTDGDGYDSEEHTDFL